MKSLNVPGAPSLKRGLVLSFVFAFVGGPLAACGSDDGPFLDPDAAPGGASNAGGGPGRAGNPGRSGAPGAGLGQPSGSPYPRCQAEFCTPVEGATPCCVSADGPCGADFGMGCVRVQGTSFGSGGRQGSGNTGGRSSGSGGRRGSGGSGSGGFGNTGGVVSTGGRLNTGGALNTGGVSPTGGATATGGTNDGDAAVD